MPWQGAWNNLPEDVRLVRHRLREPLDREHQLQTAQVEGHDVRVSWRLQACIHADVEVATGVNP